MEDVEWLPTKRGPSLAALLQRVEVSGDELCALSVAARHTRPFSVWYVL